jgi:hypothetical protein
MLKNNRQGVELTINTMIIMALALIVLIIGAVLLIKTVGRVNGSTDCSTQGGSCIAKTTACGDDKPVPGPYSCANSAERCCISMGLGQKP